MKKITVIRLLLLALFMPACSSSTQPTSSVIPISTFTFVPGPTADLALTHAALPPTATPDTLSTLVSEGQPPSEWNGIPIMPGVITGEGDEEGYVFTIKATPQQVQEYYQLELSKLGWQPFAQEDGDSSIMLMFMKDGTETLTISILSKDDQTLVLLVK